MKKRYTETETRLIRRRIRDIMSGRCYCFVLGAALAEKRVSRAAYEAMKQLKARCPMHVSGECQICHEKLDQGGIDIFEAARDLGIREAE
ncbi:hypothetical protein [Desulfobacter vibrioformis]|uniref:hypothetical protein n=1 Tax=Desulfobacter vibrioformis TaxID=34031 RepID=UPI00055749D4|nr:hypothetical protein [Desulfobacter vibrioformis]